VDYNPSGSGLYEFYNGETLSEKYFTGLMSCKELYYYLLFKKKKFNFS